MSSNVQINYSDLYSFVQTFFVFLEIKRIPSLVFKAEDFDQNLRGNKILNNFITWVE